MNEQSQSVSQVVTNDMFRTPPQDTLPSDVRDTILRDDRELERQLISSRQLSPTLFVLASKGVSTLVDDPDLAYARIRYNRVA